MRTVIFQIAAIAIMILFYLIYFFKMMKQHEKGIQTVQMNKSNADGIKDQNTLFAERLVSCMSVVIVIVQLLSIVCNWSVLTLNAQVDGVLCGILGVLLFGMAVYNMKDSWRAGIPEAEQTTLVTDGIYRYSRNPAFLGFYFMYTGILLVFFNPFLFFVTVATMSAFHLQVMEEERFLEKRFGEAYVQYRKDVFCYLGRKNGCVFVKKNER
ncbi:MAG: isoprenylcysteine carboxylmethyltransferase family protein [Lachnospiraceae bacterium]|nr:isoprenylcysteine carboxylmethyltransferase family protein [Lachnospiraceae bacterium]